MIFLKKLFLFTKDVKREGDVPNNLLFSYASGLAGQNLNYGFVSNWLQYFCINILNIDSAKIGTVFFISYFWDAINDPLIGAFVDKRKYKPYRKLKPYLLYLPPIIGVISMLMYANTSALGEAAKIAIVVLLYFMWDFIYSFQDVGLWGMVALSSPHSDERSRVAQWVSIGAGAGGTVVSLFQTIRGVMTGNFGMSEAMTFFVCGVVFCLFGELLSMLAYRMPEQIAAPPAEKETLWQSISVLRHNPKLLLISLARFCKDTNLKVQNAYFFENAVTFTNGQNLETISNIAPGIPGTAAIFFSTKIARKIGGMKKVLLIAQASSAVLRIIAFFVGYNSWGQFITYMVLISITGIFGNMMDIAHRSLTSDSIDEVEYKTGMRSEGISFSMQNFTTKMAGGANKLIEGILLKVLKYDAKADTQNPTFVKWLWPMYCLAPVLGNILYLIVISFIKDNREDRERIEAELKKRRAEALAEISE